MKPGRSADTMTCLPSCAAEVADGVDGLVGRVAAADELDERHDRHGAEEVHADEPLAARRGRPPRPGDGWRSTRCSRRRSRAAAASPSISRQSAVLTATSSNTASMTRSASATRPSRSVASMRASVASRLVGGQAALRDRPVEVAGDPLAAGLGAGQVRLVERDRQPDRRVDLGDAVAHQPGPRDEDPLDRGRHGGDGTAVGPLATASPGPRVSAS